MSGFLTLLVNLPILGKSPHFGSRKTRNLFTSRHWPSPYFQVGTLLGRKEISQRFDLNFGGSSVPEFSSSPVARCGVGYVCVLVS
jgi:hypothetical protein